MKSMGKREKDALKWLGIPDGSIEDRETTAMRALVKLTSSLKRPVTTTELAEAMKTPRVTLSERLHSLMAAGCVFKIAGHGWVPYKLKELSDEA